MSWLPKTKADYAHGKLVGMLAAFRGLSELERQPFVKVVPIPSFDEKKPAVDVPLIKSVACKRSDHT